MAAMTVTTTPQQVPTGWSLAQNLGPGTVWFASTAANASATNGVQLPVGGVLDPFVGDQTPSLWVMVASGTADLRYYLNTPY